jgi:hypothetical protein
VVFSPPMAAASPAQLTAGWRCTRRARACHARPQGPTVLSRPASFIAPGLPPGAEACCCGCISTPVALAIPAGRFFHVVCACGAARRPGCALIRPEPAHPALLALTPASAALCESVARGGAGARAGQRTGAPAKLDALRAVARGRPDGGPGAHGSRRVRTPAATARCMAGRLWGSARRPVVRRQGRARQRGELAPSGSRRPLLPMGRSACRLAARRPRAAPALHLAHRRPPYLLVVRAVPDCTVARWWPT